MNRFKQIKDHRQTAHARLLALKLKALDGVLPKPKKAVELAAIGVCVAVECRPCLEWHAARAAGCGATFEEVLEAVEAGIEVSGGRSILSLHSAITVISEAFATKQVADKNTAPDCADSSEDRTDDRKVFLEDRQHALV
jgi:AhpD family alkylhydroperoxidase